MENTDALKESDVHENDESGCSAINVPLNQNASVSLRVKPSDKSYLDCISPLAEFRKTHKKQFIFGHLNVNSFRWKFPEVRDELLTNNILDLAFFLRDKT